MNDNYICPNCHAYYTAEQLQDNIDGTCDYCGYPLQSINNQHTFSHSLDEAPNIYEIKFLKLCQDLRLYSLDEVWHSIELIKNYKDRIIERKLLFEALKKIGKKFELYDE